LLVANIQPNELHSSQWPAALGPAHGSEYSEPSARQDSGNDLSNSRGNPCHQSYLFLAHRSSPTLLVAGSYCAHGRPPHQEYERNHRQRGNAQHPEVVQISYHVRLPKYGTVKPTVCLLLRGQSAGGHEDLARSLNR